MSEKMLNAPVYYTLTQAQFNPVAAMEKYIDEIQDKLRLSGYTLFEAQKITQLRFQSSSSASTKAEFVELPIWQFTRANQSAGFTLGKSSLAFHTTRYETHKQFFNEFLSVLEIVHNIVKLEHLSRLGLRYLNAVLPKNDETVNQYLVTGLHGITLDIARRYSLNESVFDTEVAHSPFKGNLVNRVHYKSGPLDYPADMLPNNLLRKEQFAITENIPHAVIDIDHFIEGQVPLNIKQAEALLFSLHAGIKRAFFATITDFAKSTWA